MCMREKNHAMGGGCPPDGGLAQARSAAEAVVGLSVPFKSAAVGAGRGATPDNSVLPAAVAGVSFDSNASRRAAVAEVSPRNNRRRSTAELPAIIEDSVVHHGEPDRRGEAAPAVGGAAGVAVSAAGEAGARGSASRHAEETAVSFAAHTPPKKDVRSSSLGEETKAASTVRASPKKDEKNSPVAVVLRRAEQVSAQGKLLLFVVRLKERAEQRQKEQQQRQQEQSRFRSQREYHGELPQQVQQQQKLDVVNTVLQHVLPSRVTVHTLAAAADVGPNLPSQDPSFCATVVDRTLSNPQVPESFNRKHANEAGERGPVSSGSEEEVLVDIEDISQYLDSPSSPTRKHVADMSQAPVALHAVRSVSRRRSSSCHDSSRRRSYHNSSSSTSNSKESCSYCTNYSFSPNRSNTTSESSVGVLKTVDLVISDYSFEAKEATSALLVNASGLPLQLTNVSTEGREVGGNQKHTEEVDCTSAAGGATQLDMVQWVPLHAKPLPSVTDFSAQLWCEQQLQFTLQTGIRRETVAMKKGTARHLALELLYHDLETVFVDTEEEVVAFKLLNSIRQLQQLQQKGICREVWVFGFVRDTAIRGVIDELRITRISRPYLPLPSLAAIQRNHGGGDRGATAVAAATAARLKARAEAPTAASSTARNHAFDSSEGLRKASAVPVVADSSNEANTRGAMPATTAGNDIRWSSTVSPASTITASRATVDAEEEIKNRGLYVLLSDNKTRSIKKAPGMAQKRSSALQLQVYWHLLQQLRSDEFPLEAFLDAFNLNGEARIENPLLLAATSKAGVDWPPLLKREEAAAALGSVASAATAASSSSSPAAAVPEMSVTATLSPTYPRRKAAAAQEDTTAAASGLAGVLEAAAGDSKAEAATDTEAAGTADGDKTTASEKEDEDMQERYKGQVQAADLLRRLLLKLQEEVQRLPPLWKDVHVVYECDGEEFEREEIPCHRASLLHSLDDMLGWWRGHRAAEPVQPMEKWKCRSCIFLKDCKVSPLDAEQREAALAAQAEAAEAEKRALEEYEESAAASVTAASASPHAPAERQQHQAEQQEPQATTPPQQTQSVVHTHEQEQGQEQREPRRYERDPRPRSNSPVTKPLLQQSQHRYSRDQKGLQSPSFLLPFSRRLSSSQSHIHPIESVPDEMQQQQTDNVVQFRPTRQQGSLRSHQYSQQPERNWSPQKQQPQILRTLSFPASPDRPVTKSAGQGGALAGPSPAASLNRTSLPRSYGNPYPFGKEVPEKGTRRLPTVTLTHLTRGGVADASRTAVPGIAHEYGQLPAAPAAVTLSSDVSNNARGTLSEAALYSNTHAGCSAHFTPPAATEHSSIRDVQHKYILADTSHASSVDDTARTEAIHNNISDATRYTSACLGNSAAAAAVGDADTNVELGHAQSLQAVQWLLPAAAGSLSHSGKETAPPTALVSPFLKSVACAAADASDHPPSACVWEPDEPVAAAGVCLASKDTVLSGNQACPPVGFRSDKERICSGATGTHAPTDDREQAEKTTVTTALTGAGEKATREEDKYMHGKRSSIAGAGKRERLGSVFPTCTLSRVPLRTANPAKCWTTDSYNGRRSSQMSPSSPNSSFVAPSKRTRSLVAGGAAGVATVVAADEQLSPLKNKDANARLLEREPVAGTQPLPRSKGHKQVPRRTSSFPAVSSKSQTQITRYFITEKPPL